MILLGKYIENDEAIISCDEQTLTKKEFFSLLHKIAFGDLGLSPGDNVGIRLQNSIYFHLIIIKCVISEINVFVLHADTTPEGLEKRRQTFKLKMVITDDILPLFLKTCDAPPDKRIATNKKGKLILMSTGSTGEPKGIVSTYDALINRFQSYRETYKMENKVSYFTPLHFTSPMCLMHALTTLFAGGKVYFLKNYGLGNHDFLKGSDINFMDGTPSTWHLYINNGNEMIQSIISGCVTKVLGGDHCPDELLRGLSEKFNGGFLDTYGSAETGIVLARALEDPQKKYRQASRVAVKIQNEILHVKSAGLFEGYVGDDNENILLEDGFWQTADLAKFLDDGSIALLGRSNLSIKKGGKLINPAEIDAALESHPDVEQSITIAVDNKWLGAIMISFIVTKDTKISTHNIKQFLRSKLEPFKIPEHVFAVTDLPYTRGKVDRKELNNKAIELLKQQ